MVRCCMYVMSFVALMCVFTSNIPFSPEPLSFVYVDVEAVDLVIDIRSGQGNCVTPVLLLCHPTGS